MKNLKRLIKRAKCKKGFSNFLSFSVVCVFFIGMLIFQISALSQTSKIDKLEQMASLIAKEISLTGKVDKNIDNQLDYLENNVFHMDVDLDVRGDFKGNSRKLQMESDFEVIITYDTTFDTPFHSKEKTYYGKAVGKVENYSKG